MTEPRAVAEWAAALVSHTVGPLVDPAQRLFAPGLLVALAVGVGLWWWRDRHAAGPAVEPGSEPASTLLSYLFPRSVWLSRSSLLDGQLWLLRSLVRVAGVVPATGAVWALGLLVVGLLDSVVGYPEALAGFGGGGGAALGGGAAVLGGVAPSVWISVLYTGTLFVAWDASRYVLHRLLHGVPLLWQFHQVHHSADQLTPLTFHRSHPVETALYWLRSLLVTGVLAGVFFWAFRGAASQWQILGVGAVGLLFNLLGGNLRHSHLWLSYGARVERWLLSPAQHQLHHSIDAREHRRNYGSWLALWDRLGGTFLAAGARRELVFGLPKEGRNHDPHDLLSALFGPVVGAGRVVGDGGLRGLLLVGALLVAGLAIGAGEVFAEEAAGDEDEDEDEDDGDGEDEGSEGDGDGDEGADDADDAVSIFGRRGGAPYVAGSAHAVQQAELERREDDDIERLLAPVPGVYVRGEDGYGLRPNIGLRGASSDRSSKVTLMEDGVLLAPAPYSAPAAYYFPLATRMTQVEVFKGPAATRYGPNTVGGAVNLVTRPVPVTPKAGLDVAMGLNRARKAHGYLGGSLPWGGFLVEGAYLADDGFKVLDGGGPTGFDKSEFMVKLRLTPPDRDGTRHALQLKLGYANERSHETYVGLTQDDFDANPTRRYAATQQGLMAWHRSQVEGSYRLQIGEDVDVLAVAYHHAFDRSWERLAGFRGGTPLSDLVANPDGGQAAVYMAVLRGDEDSVGDDQTLLVTTNRRRFHAWGGQTRLRWRKAKGLLSHELEVGVRLHWDQIRRDHSDDGWLMRSGRMVEDGGDSVVTRSNLGSAFAVAVHAHEELGIGPLRLVPGLRVEVVRTEFDDDLEGSHAQATNVALMPGLGAYVQATPWLGVLAGVHRGTSPVSPGQLDDVRPESAWNVELGARADHRGFHGELIGFISDYQNLTGTCTSSNGCPDGLADQQTNGGAVFVYGAELLLRQRLLLPEGLSLDGSLSYTWTGSRFRSEFDSPNPQFDRVKIGDRLPYVPEHRGAVSLGFDFVYGAVEVSAAAQTGMRDTASQGPLDPGLDVPGHVVLDLSAEGRPLSWLKVYGTIKNLTNQQYVLSRRPIGARPGRPFHAMLGVKIEGPIGQR